MFASLAGGSNNTNHNIYIYFTLVFCYTPVSSRWLGEAVLGVHTTYLLIFQR